MIPPERANPIRPPAGWYPDPHGSQQMRWFDGVEWTDAVQMTDYQRQMLAVAKRSARSHERTRGAVTALFCLAVAVASGVAGLWLITVIFGIACLVTMTRSM